MADSRSLAALTRRLLLAALVAAVSVSAQTTTANWPQWRGPKRDAISPETGLLPQWPAQGPTLAWKMHGLGVGLSSVVIVGNKGFTMGNMQVAGQPGQCVMALDLTQHQRLWQTKIGPASDGAHCTPTIDGNTIYALGTSGDLAAVDTGTGQELWHKNLVRDFGGQVPGWNFSESPLVDGELVVATPGGATAMVALNKKTGAVVWKCVPPNPRVTGAPGHASVVVSEGAGVRQYVTLMSGSVIGVAADTGKLLWSYARVANTTANIATPVTYKDWVFASSAYGVGAALLKLVKTPDGVKAEEVYFLPAGKFQCHHGGFLRVGDYIYGANGHNAGHPICIELATGTVKWSQQVGGGSGSLIYADKHLYFRWENDTVALIEATPERYVLKSTFQIPKEPGMDGPGWAHPSIAGGKLYIRHQDVLFCYDVKAK